MTGWNQLSFGFSQLGRRNVEAGFSGNPVTSDGGGLLLREIDRELGLTERLAEVLFDPRDESRCDHGLVDLLRQRIYALALGYEDVTDHDTLRHDPGIQTAVNRAEALASSPTLCRFENRADRKTAWAIHRVLVEQFIASFATPPEELILDFDATDDPVHGAQEGRFFHGYYDRYCFLPLYVFCKDQLLVSYLRPSNIDAARHAWAILSLLVKRFRQAWPGVRIVFRGDSGFCRWRMLAWCETHDVGYIVGIAKNNRLNALAEAYLLEAERLFEEQGSKQRLFFDVQYGAKTWNKERRVIVKAEHAEGGRNPRYVATNLPGEAQALYDTLYCARGEMENRIKEQQLDLFAGRTSCHRWWPNQFRLLLASVAYALMEAIRRLALKGTELARAQCSTIRTKLFKIGAVVVRNTRRVRFLLSCHYPYQELFLLVAARLTPK